MNSALIIVLTAINLQPYCEYMFVCLLVHLTSTTVYQQLP